MVLTCGCVWWGPQGTGPIKSPGRGLPEDGEMLLSSLETAPLPENRSRWEASEAPIWL